MDSPLRFSFFIEMRLKPAELMAIRGRGASLLRCIATRLVEIDQKCTKMVQKRSAQGRDAARKSQNPVAASVDEPGADCRG